MTGLFLKKPKAGTGEVCHPLCSYMMMLNIKTFKIDFFIFNLYCLIFHLIKIFPSPHVLQAIENLPLQQ